LDPKNHIPAWFITYLLDVCQAMSHAVSGSAEVVLDQFKVLGV